MTEDEVRQIVNQIKKMESNGHNGISSEITKFPYTALLV